MPQQRSSKAVYGIHGSDEQHPYFFPLLFWNAVACWGAATTKSLRPIGTGFDHAVLVNIILYHIFLQPAESFRRRFDDY